MKSRETPKDERKSRILIEVMNGPEDGKVIACKGTPISIGRATENTVHLPYDHLISRHHARIDRSQDEFILHDLKSTNGTYVGSERVRDSLPLEPKKLFRVGATLLVIRLRSA